MTARIKRLRLILSVEEEDALIAEAERVNLPLATWARSTLLKEAKNGNDTG